MKRLLLLLICLCLLWTPFHPAQGQEILSRATLDSPVTYYQEANVLFSLGSLPAGTAIEILDYGETGWELVRFVQGDGHGQGWIKRLNISTDQPQLTGVQSLVLCESLSLRAEPSALSQRIHSFPYGTLLTIDSTQGEWYSIVYYDGTYYYYGWVLRDYLLVNPQYITLTQETPAYAYPSPNAPRVGLLDIHSSHPIIAEMDGYTVISLRGASAFIENP